MALVKFYRGNKAKYDATKFVDGIYFSLDTKEVLVNGSPFGYFSGDHNEIESVEYTAPNIITINYYNGNSDTITLQYASAGISEEASKGGLMTQAFAHKLGKVADGAQVNVIETIALDGTNLAVANKKVNIDTTAIRTTIAQNKVTAKDASVEIIEGSGTGASLQATKVAVKVVPNGGLETAAEGLRVNESALTTYTGDSKAIVVDADATNRSKKVSLKVNQKAGNIVSATSDGVYASVKLKSLEVGADEKAVATRYGLVGVAPDGTEISVSDVTIDILKDKFLKSVELGTIPTGEPGAGNDALVFTFIIADGTESVRYVDVSSFLREAEVGNGIMLTADKKLAIKVNATANEKDSKDAAYLQVDADGIKLVGINAELKAAKTEVSVKTGGHISVAVATQSDGHNKVTVSESDIASAQDLNGLATRVSTAENDITDLNTALGALETSISWHEAD